jgi:hypothetical protein
MLKLLSKEELIKSMDGLIIGKSGTKEWYKKGHKNCLDGPAIEYANGDKHWYKEGNCIGAMVQPKSGQMETKNGT